MQAFQQFIIINIASHNNFRISTYYFQNHCWRSHLITRKAFTGQQNHHVTKLQSQWLYVITFVSHLPISVQISRQPRQLYRKKNCFKDFERVLRSTAILCANRLGFTVKLCLGLFLLCTSSFEAHAQQWLHNIVHTNCSLERASAWPPP